MALPIKDRAGVRSLLQGRGLTAAQSSIVVAALEQAHGEGLRGIRARRRARALCESKDASINWEKFFEKLGPFIELLLKLLPFFL